VIARLIRSLGEVIEVEPAPPPGVAVVENAWIPALSGLLAGMRQPAAAVTLGRTIVLHPRACATPRLLRHELAHVRQWQHAPFTFPVRYVWNHLRHGYRDNPYEVEARAAEAPSIEEMRPCPSP
jgi:hypothetical protein